MDERLVIRSYRRVFEVDRRIYRVDRWALPVPGGVPLRGLGYFIATLLFVIVGGRLPGLAPLLELLSAPLRYVVLPLAVAVLGTQAAPDGRSAHRFASDWVCFRVRAHRRSAGRVVALDGEPVRWDGELAIRWDADAPALQHARIVGPARVTFNVPTTFGDSGGAVVLCARTELEVRP